MAISSVARTVDAVTRLCFYQGAGTGTWTRSVTELASDGIDVEKDSTDALLALLSEAEMTPPALYSYLEASVQSPTPLVRPSYLVKSLLTPIASSTLPLSTLESIFSIINTARESRDRGDALYLASSPEEIAQGLIDLSENVLARVLSSRVAASSEPEILRWTHRFISRQTRNLSSRTLQGTVLLSTCQRTVERLLDMIAQIDYTPSDVASLVGPLTALRARLNANGNKRRPVPKLSRSAGGPELDLFVSTMYATTPRTIRPDLSSRLSAILEYRQTLAEFISTSKDDATVEVFSELFDAAVQGYTSDSTARPEHVKQSILAIKFPGILVKVVGAGQPLRTALADAVRSKTRPQEAMEIDKDSSRSGAIRELLAGLCRAGLIPEDLALSVDKSIPRSQLARSTASSFDLQSRLTSHDPDEVKQTLALLTTDVSVQAELSSSICEVIESHAESSDLDALSHFCDALIQDPATLEIVFVHETPRRLLAPIRQTLDSLDTAQDNFGESNLIERYGNLVVVVEIVVHRFGLAGNLAYHLGSFESFISRWIPTSSAAYSLASLDEEGRTAVAGFISALFGDGISDDLMHTTNPRTLLRVAPTILKQSLVACQHGIVDLDSLKDALSYFLQELLSFTLPGVLRWLMGEIERTPPSPAQNAMYDILQVILFAETLPKTVLELVSADVAALLSGASPLASTSPSTFDSNRAKRLVIGFLKMRCKAPIAASGSAPSYSAQLEEGIAALARQTESESYMNAALVQQAIARLVPSHRPGKIVTDLLSHLSALVPDLPDTPHRSLSLDEERDLGLRVRIERIGAAVLSESPKLLDALLDEVVPSLVSDEPFLSPAERTIDSNRVTVVADIVAGALSLALGQANKSRRSQVSARLDRLADTLHSIVEKIKIRASRDDSDPDNPSLATLFIARLASYDALSQASTAFSSLSRALP